MNAWEIFEVFRLWALRSRLAGHIVTGRRIDMKFPVSFGLSFLGILLSGPIGVSQSTYTILASGLENPRGLAFSPQGVLYVAEAGTGGSTATTDIQCMQVPFPVGPYTGGFTSRISRIDADGSRTTVVDGLPSDMTNPLSGGFLSGIADVAFIGNRMYGLTSGSGCSHGRLGTFNEVFQVIDGNAVPIANLSAFQQANPVVDPEPDDFEPDGTWFSMVSHGDALYAMEPNHGELDKITAKGEITRISDISASQGHIVPTTVVFHDGYFYFGNLWHFPIEPGSSNVYRLNPRTGEITIVASGFTTIEGIDFDRRGNLYVLESMTLPGFPTPAEAESGKITRVSPSGDRDTVLAGLSFPSAMKFGPDGKLYISNLGFAAPPGVGQILRVDVQ